MVCSAKTNFRWRFQDKTMQFDVLIVGAGHGGAQVAAMLRQLKYEGSIAIVGDESELPYQRPPLSKEYFASEKEFDQILLRPQQFWTEHDITMLLGARVTGVDPAAHAVTTEGGEAIGYSKLVWATGGSPRKLPIPGGDLSNVFGVRTKVDADAMKQAAKTAQNVTVIGGGYIGLEAAAVLSKLGKNVTILEALDRVLARVAGEEISRFYEAAHRAHGVEVRLNVKVAAIEGANAATGVQLAGGEILPADFVVVGIGIIPAVQPLLDAGANGGNGVDVNDFCETSIADIYAIGDCAAHSNKFAGGDVIRLESVQNANDQGRTVAKHICGNSEAYEAVPWFWSNQFNLRLQTVGLSAGHDQSVLRGDTDKQSFSVIYLKAGRVIALDCVNAPRDYVQGKLLIKKHAAPAAADLANPEIMLKDLATA
jgi:3-phenylpropionate/trans-cinnamate dioxygenase ferredoxin reductase component